MLVEDKTDTFVRAPMTLGSNTGIHDITYDIFCDVAASHYSFVLISNDKSKFTICVENVLSLSSAS